MRERCRPGIPDCCDMRGMLSFHILWILSKGPMDGQRVVEELGKRRGYNPSPGTIYPALKDLRRRGIVKMERRGRATVYRLTNNGRKGLERACIYFCNAFGEIFSEYIGEGTR